MPLAVGDTLGPYEILSRIGEGGMGEVWKARDTRLNRIVAIKTSKTDFSERIEREAHAVAALNHPAICTLHDVGPNYLVFEFVAGEPLKGPLPLAKALEYAMQICDALDAAHSKNITHRDLKPANILVTRQGVKLLDFGLAKIDQPIDAGVENVTMAVTMKGQILGTLSYMSPEQLHGKEADARSDIFSFGCVLYEMLTGAQAFQGGSAASVIAAIVEHPAPSIADVAPPALDRVLKRCLEKDPENRWQSARDTRAALEIVGASEDASKSPVAASSSGIYSRLPWAVSLALALTLGTMASVNYRQEPPIEKAVRFQVAAPEKYSLIGAPVVSPDGRSVAFVARDVNSRLTVWVRPLDSLEAKEITSPNEEGAFDPFWSPDSRFVGYAADGKLKKVAVTGGAPQVLCDVAAVFTGATWNPDGVIVFGLWSSTAGRSGLWSVRDSGGVPEQLAAIPPPDDAGAGFAFSPTFLPDGEHLLYVQYSAETAAASSFGVYLGSVAGIRSQQPPRRVLSASSQVIFAPSPADRNRGHLLFLQGNVLNAQPFDTSTLELTGDPIALVAATGAGAPGQGEAGRSNRGFFSASANGVLVFRPGSASRQQLTWLDRRGTALGTVGEPGGYSEIDLSPDGKRLAGVRDGDIWIIDLERNVTARFTLDAAGNRAPVWSRDGTRLAFESQRDGKRTIVVKAADGGSQQSVYAGDEQSSPSDFAPDGQALVFTATRKTGTDVLLLPLAAGFTPTPPARALVNTQFQEGQGKISPDGRWMVYASGESGRNEAYVRPFPTGDAKWLVSKGTGVEFRWRGDNREVYYRSGDHLMAVEIRPGATFQPGQPRELFQAPIVGAGGFNRNPSYVVTPDGQKFLALLAPTANLSDAMTVVLNWQADDK